MAEFTVIHNGSTTLPLKASSEGVLVPDATLDEIHESCQTVLKDQIRHAVLAEEYGYDRISYTEHHFQLVGAEYSPNPLLTEMAVAAQTEEIRLAQFANIITWHDPIRFAEQAAQLDVISDGRADIGIGRGYQPREAEVLGDQYWGGTAQDQEKNRVAFQEKLDIILEAWTEDAVSYVGEYHAIPPSHTKWHHDQERLWLEEESEHEVEDYIDWKEGDLYSKGLWSPVVSGGSTLNAIGVFPRPVQKPHPPLWQPVTSYRSIRWAARNGVNAISFGDPNVADNIGVYHEEAEKAGWPDHRPEYDGEPFGRGWDETRQRGMAVGKWVFNTDAADEETLERWKLGLEFVWDYFGPFGFNRAITGDIDVRPTADDMIEAGVAFVGDTEEIIDCIETFQTESQTTDLHLGIYFEVGGITGEEADEQLVAFAERVMPHFE